jgi:threonine/homoserine/homoserine lactone efflux protein
VHTALAAAGVSALIAATPVWFRSLAIAGALYLAWLGIRGFRGSGGLSIGQSSRAGVLRACRDATLCNLLNPKVIVLFLALYPNFLVPDRGDVTAQIATLSVVLLVINVVWQSALVCGADMARQWFGRADVQRAVGRTTGLILLGFAGVMVWEHVV